MGPNDADGMANSVDPDQTAQSDLGLHSLPRHICPKTYNNTNNNNVFILKGCHIKHANTYLTYGPL